MSKIFIIGLPRTGTTSVCLAFLELGFRVAHTSYTQASFERAQVIADTPIFCDYPKLDREYPNAKFIYLDRPFEHWLPSIRQLLVRMFKNLTRNDGGFNPTLKRCYQEVFKPLSMDNITNDSFLEQCFIRHQDAAINYFKDRPNDFTMISVAEACSYGKLLQFLQLNLPIKQFEKINIGGKITAWNKIKHPLKVDANLKR